MDKFRVLLCFVVNVVIDSASIFQDVFAGTRGNDYPNVSEATLMNMCKAIRTIH